MLKQLQKAYERRLKNLVFVNFSKRMKEKDLSELVLLKEKACCKDIITAINWYLREGNSSAVRKRINTLEKSVARIERLEDQLKEQRRNNLYEIASRLCEQGRSTKVVRFKEIRAVSIKKLLNRSND